MILEKKFFRVIVNLSLRAATLAKNHVGVNPTDGTPSYHRSQDQQGQE
jgi:hypothetical protein